jgi:hypothetical protein
LAAVALVFLLPGPAPAVTVRTTGR